MEPNSIIDILMRWGHVLAGITWIGLLYYFNFVQTEYFKEADPDARTDAFTKLAPRALWWFRWGAMLTLLTGLVMLWIRHRGLSVDIVIGSAMAIVMFLNVWLVIWPNQKIVIASNEQIKGGGEALPEAAAAAPRAALASRTNTLLSIPMLYFMITSAHGPAGSMMSNMTGLVVVLAILALIEANALFGKMGPLASIRGVVVSGFVLWAVCVLVLANTQSGMPMPDPKMPQSAPTAPMEAAPASEVMGDADMTGEMEAPAAAAPAADMSGDGATAEADSEAADGSGDSADAEAGSEAASGADDGADAEADGEAADGSEDAGDAEADGDAEGGAQAEPTDAMSAEPATEGA